MATTDPVYNPTTTQETTSKNFFKIPTDNLDVFRFFIKVAEVILSFLAFVLEEVVISCVSCSPLYFFEFVSCTAFLFTALLLILLSTVLHQKVGIDCWPAVDFCYTGGIGLFFLISAIVFASDNGGTSVEKAAVAFGFLATIAFAVDICRFLMTKGLPFKKSNPAPGEVQPEHPEEEKLRSNGTE
ncbi:CKLF-like MARVEL transmembrane domain-containing protein 6 [Anguilla anguilla]|uniref:CKLF-like MARVEL transmembrane domain-containing protein 6 n=1 Tax=Anguilla anguilla TaxID=7936 RepID=UPI0015B33593|nr:CKLF-like MARVEL transmembrane domain-containing protein 6 [Anguilla anguilla]XP_035274558.1 CKLF-like MARVEL transmembrane domain-containing protein 6 [Anguilla anguilla]